MAFGWVVLVDSGVFVPGSLVLVGVDPGGGVLVIVGVVVGVLGWVSVVAVSEFSVVGVGGKGTIPSGVDFIPMPSLVSAIDDVTRRNALSVAAKSIILSSMGANSNGGKEL